MNNRIGFSRKFMFNSFLYSVPRKGKDSGNSRHRKKLKRRVLGRKFVDKRRNTSGSSWRSRNVEDVKRIERSEWLRREND